MAGLFRTLTPSWAIQGVHACTFLASDSENFPVSFSLQTDLGKFCRERLEDLIQPFEPICWLKQVHGNTLVELPLENNSVEEQDIPAPMQPLADASFTIQPGVVCAILTADCLPIVLAKSDGSVVAAIHAGRRGLENGIIPKTIQQLGDAEMIFAWIGPGIAASSYPISLEIKDAFLQQNPNLSYVFKPSVMGDFCMDLSEIARVQLLNSGVLEENISTAIKNTYTDPNLHSARRDGDASGRMATIVWMD